MARRGQFGRLPRAAPDLTNTIVALVREANAMEDSNYVDAWKNGGKVDGKGVDDDRLLEHMRMRRDQLSKDDPAWDQWNNRVTQYDFSINESKMSLKYDQKKITEQEMSNFYKKWAGRSDIQQDSEFYRHLLSQQAKWHTAASQGSASRGRSNAAANHNKWVTGIIKDKLQGAVNASSAILGMAIAYGAAPPNATSLDDVYENSDGWTKVLDVIEDGVSADPYIQGKIDEATKEIRKTEGKDWTWSKSSLAALWDESDEGNKQLIRGATSPTEKKQWTKNRADMGYEQQRIKGAKASQRIAEANVTWQAEMDNCNGDAFCARAVTQTYRDTLVKNGKFIVGGQGVIKSSMEDQAQVQMFTNTVRQLDDILAGKPVQGTPGTSATTGPRTKSVVPLTQQDAIHGTTEPGNFIADTGNAFNADIDKIVGGGWVSSEPTILQDGTPMVDGNNNPIFHIVTHAANDPKPPGLVAIKGSLAFEDRNTPQDRGVNAGQPTIHRPVQYVQAVPASVLVEDEGGNLVEADAVGRPGGSNALPGSVQQTAPAAGYATLHVVGPDGKTRVMYRTGNGTSGPNGPYMYHTEPPVAHGTKFATDPKTGVKTPILTATPVTVPPKTPGDLPTTELVYDTTPLTTGFTESRTQLKSGNFVLGTYRTTGATATAQSINDIFAKDGSGATSPQSMADATKMLDAYKANVAALPDNDFEKVQAALDLPQLTQWTQMHGGGKVGQTYDDDYGTNNDRTPQQMRYEQQLAGGGFTAQRWGEDEVGRRITMLEEIDKAETRVNERAAEILERAGPYQRPGAFGYDETQRDLLAIASAKRDVLNPNISVSGITVPGFAGLFQPKEPKVVVPVSGPGTDPVTGNPIVPGLIDQKVPPVPFAAPVVRNGPPVQGPTSAAAASVGVAPTVKPPTAPKPTPLPKTPGLVAPPTSTLSADALRRQEEERRNRHGATEFDF